MEALKHEGIISNLSVAFSRDDGSLNQPNRPKYVQHLMTLNECSARLMDIIVIQKGVVYICGDGNKMARDVQDVISELLGARLAGTGVSGGVYLEEMKSKGRLLMDIWTS